MFTALVVFELVFSWDNVELVIPCVELVIKGKEVDEVSSISPRDVVSFVFSVKADVTPCVVSGSVEKTVFCVDKHPGNDELTSFLHVPLPKTFSSLKNFQSKKKSISKWQNSTYRSPVPKIHRWFVKVKLSPLHLRQSFDLIKES